jgi:hypothetical protein
MSRERRRNKTNVIRTTSDSLVGIFEAANRVEKTKFQRLEGA